MPYLVFLSPKSIRGIVLKFVPEYGSKVAQNWQYRADDMQTEKRYTDIVPNWEWAKERPFRKQYAFGAAFFIA